MIGRPFGLVLCAALALSATSASTRGEEILIVERINGYLGYPAVARLRLRQGPLATNRRRRRPLPATLSAAAEASLSERMAGVEDAELRGALESLGRAVLGSRQQGVPAESTET